MKTLLLIRHAKSSWEQDVRDFDRPLNERGKRDAPAMAKRLLSKNVKLDLFISSPAKRAFTTATFFAEAYEKKQKDILIIPELYEPSLIAFTTAIHNLDDAFKHVAIFSHNPGISLFANRLTITTIDDMPTCAIFAVKADRNSWKDFDEAKKEFWFFDYPKA